MKSNKPPFPIIHYNTNRKENPMKQLIPMDEYGVFADIHDTARANSLMVAKMFGKDHNEVQQAWIR